MDNLCFTELSSTKVKKWMKTIKMLFIVVLLPSFEN